MAQPDDGCATLLGHDMATMPAEVRRRVAYIAEGHPLYEWMAVQQTIDIVAPFYSRWNGRLVDQIVDHSRRRGGGSCVDFRRPSATRVQRVPAVAPTLNGNEIFA